MSRGASANSSSPSKGSGRKPPPASVCIFEMCLHGLHASCVRYGPLPNTIGGVRVVCGCSCHSGQNPDWKPSDADRMATYFAFEYGTDPRVDQIVEGRFYSAVVWLVWAWSKGLSPGLVSAWASEAAARNEEQRLRERGDETWVESMPVKERDDGGT